MCMCCTGIVTELRSPPPPGAASQYRPPCQPCRATRRYLLKHPNADWADVPELPKAAVELLSRDFVRCTSRVVHCQSSADGETSKLLLDLQDGLQVEAVIMRYDTTGEDTAGCGATQAPAPVFSATYLRREPEADCVLFQTPCASQSQGPG